MSEDKEAQIGSQKQSGTSGSHKAPVPLGGEPGRGNGDPVQRAAREARIKQKLRENLKRRKQKAKALDTDKA